MSDQRTLLTNAMSFSSGDETIDVLHRLRQDLGCDVVATLRRTADAVAAVSMSASTISGTPDIFSDLGESRWDACALHGTAGIWFSDISGFDAVLLLVDRHDRNLGLFLGFSDSPRPVIMRRANSVCRVIFPTIAELLQSRMVRARELQRSDWLEAALHELNLGVCLVTASGVVEFANRWMSDLLAQNDGIRLSNGAIGATSIKDSLRLHVMIDHAAQRSHPAGSDMRDDEVLMLALHRSQKRRPLMLAAFPADGMMHNTGSAAAILLVVDTEADVSRALVPICRLNNLSPVETRLACHLATGRSLSEASQAMHVKEQTARAYLRQIFQKTGTNRQAELIRLMMSSLLPMRSCAYISPIT